METMNSSRTIATLATLLAVTSLISGCRVENNEHGDGNHVKVATPFGGVNVKTNDSSVLDGLGLPIYPGAQFQQDPDHKNGSADVDLHLGSFALRVKSAAFKSPDSPDKLIAFYRQALTRYGDVIECQHGQTIGSLTHTAQGLTCDEDKHSHSEGDAQKIKLLAGSKQHQHVAIIGPDGTASKLQLVALDLPGHSFDSNDDDNNEHKQ
jgi:hypothetical protein